eukprot:s1560_g22.t1
MQVSSKTHSVVNTHSFASCSLLVSTREMLWLRAEVAKDLGPDPGTRSPAQAPSATVEGDREQGILTGAARQCGWAQLRHCSSSLSPRCAKGSWESPRASWKCPYHRAHSTSRVRPLAPAGAAARGGFPEEGHQGKGRERERECKIQ